MKFRRNLYLVPLTLVTMAVAVLSLVSIGIAGYYNLSFGAGWFSIAVSCCVISAVGAICLGWYSIKLVTAVASIAEQLEQTTPSLPMTCKSHNFMVERLGQAIKTHFNDNTSHTADLEKQVGELKIQFQLANKQKSNTEAIIQSIRDAVIVVDEQDRLLIANHAAGELFDFDVNTAKLKFIDDLVIKADDKGHQFAEFLKRSRQAKVNAKRQELAFIENGTPKIFDCIVSCIYDDDQQVSGAVAVLHDVTREKEVSQMKNDFVSHVSHELKTPLASIKAYSEMLLDGEANDETTKQQFYVVIQSQADRLNRLIEDILNTARIESGMIKVEKAPVSLEILIEEQIQMIRSYAEEKNIEIIRPESEDLIVFGQVYVDKDMISQVIVNLLSNAVKYTPAGGTIRVDTEVDDAAGLARVSVTDSGVGIPEDEVDYVFDKFYRVGANKAQAKGTGLGLNLVKQIVEDIHGGRVFVTSRQGQGSTFGFELSLANAEVVEV